MEKIMLKDNLKKYRSINEMTQKGVADLLGVDRTTYSKYESGAAHPQFNNLVKMAKIFGVCVTDLCGEDYIMPDFGDNLDFTSDELRLLGDFRTLSDLRKREIMRVMNRLTKDQKKDDVNTPA